MSQNVLGSVTLSYEPVWNQWRKCFGVRLRVEPLGAHAPDGQHLLTALSELWANTHSTLALRVSTQALLTDLLAQTPAQSVWLEVPLVTMQDATVAGHVIKAQQRGVRLLWCGEPGDEISEEHARSFASATRALTPHQALSALRASLRRIQGTGGHQQSPVAQGCLYEGLASQALVEHALDQQGAWGVIGWPSEEIIYNYRFRQIQPSRNVLMGLVQGIDADESLELLEQRLGTEPLLTYRFLRYANSASLGLRREVGGVHDAIMTLGYARLRHWLMEQMPHASSDLNLDPIRAAMVMRARIMERLADAGVEDDLRREVFLCGIFSQVDLLLGESLGTSLHHLPLPGRVSSAILGQTGPYAAWLEVASALESGSTRMVRNVCNAHQIEADEVNRALLRTLVVQASASDM